MSETFFTDDFVQSFSFFIIIQVQSSKTTRFLRLCLDASISALFFSGWFMGASSKYKQHSSLKLPVFWQHLLHPLIQTILRQQDQCAVYKHRIVSDIGWMSWSCEAKSLSVDTIIYSFPPTSLPPSLSTYLPPSPHPSLSTSLPLHSTLSL